MEVIFDAHEGSEMDCRSIGWAKLMTRCPFSLRSGEHLSRAQWQSNNVMGTEKLRYYTDVIWESNLGLLEIPNHELCLDR